MAHAQDNSQKPTTGEAEATTSSTPQDLYRGQIPTNIPSGKEKKLQKQYSKSFEDRKNDAEDFIKNYSFKDETKFFETKAYKDGCKMFAIDSCLGIVGAPCTGKSTLIAQILHKFKQANVNISYTFVLMSESTHLEDLREELKKIKNCVLIVDSMFAIHKYTQETGESWLRKFETVIKLVESRNLGIVFTMNSLVYNACKATFGNKPFFKHIIRLYDETYYEMTVDFKRQILANHKRVPRDGSGTAFIEEASTLSSNFGFLFWSKLLKPSDFKVTFKKPFDSIESYANETLSFYQKESEVLFLILFMGGQLDITLQDSENKRRFEQLTIVFSGIRDIDPKLCCDIFEGTFLKSEKKCPNRFSFVEPVVEYVTLKMAFRKYGNIAFEWCSLDVIMGLINIGLPNELLAKENLQSIAKCIRKNISEIHKTVDVVLRYECLRNGPFLKHILPEFTSQQSRVIAKRLINKICEDGDFECLQSAIEYLQPDDEPTDDKGRSPYQVTIYSKANDDETVNKKLKVLIINKLNYMNVDPQASNVFHLLAEKRGIKCLKFMLEFEDLKWLIKEDSDTNDRTPLHTACIEQNYEAVEFFLNNCGDKKAFVNKCDNKKRSALHYAVEYLDVEEQEQHRIIKLLLESGAMTDIQDDYGRIALHEILHCWHGVSKVIKLLLGSNKSHINTQDKCGLTPLHLATKAGNVEAVRALLLEGADVTIEDDEDEMTALMFACQDGVKNSTTILHLLLEAKSDIKLVNRFGLTALQEAVVEGKISCVEVLLKFGADPNQVSQNAKKETAVHMISSRPDPEAFELFKKLLDHGADISIRDSENKTVLDRVSNNLSMQIENYLKNK